MFHWFSCNHFGNLFDNLLQRFLIPIQCGSTNIQQLALEFRLNRTKIHLMMIKCQYKIATYPIPSPFIAPTSYGTLSPSTCRICAAALQCPLRSAVLAVIATGMMNAQLHTLRLQVPIGHVQRAKVSINITNGSIIILDVNIIDTSASTFFITSIVWLWWWLK